MHLLNARSGVRTGEVGVDERCRFGLGAGHELAIEVVCRLNRRVAHVGRDCLRVDSGSYEGRRKRVPSLVEADRPQPRRLPGELRATPEVRRLEWSGAAEHKTTSLTFCRLVLDENVAKRADDRDRRREARLFGLISRRAFSA